MSRRSWTVLLLAILIGVVAYVGREDFRDRSGSPSRPFDSPPGTPVPSVIVAPESAESPAVTAPSNDASTALVGTVLSPEGQPVDRAVVLAGWRLESRVRDGHYRIAGLPPGRYEVGAAAPGHPPVQREVRIEPGVETRLDFVLVRGGLPVAGVVTTTDGRPVAGARITIMPDREGDRAFNLIDHPRTGADGHFRIEGVPEGAIRIRAAAPFFRTSSQRVVAGATDLVFALEAGGEIHGTVVLPAGAPAAPRYRVELLNRDDGEEEALLHSDLNSEDCDGLRFFLRDLTTDTYRLEVIVPGVGRAELKEVRVQAGQVTRVELPVTEGLALTGRVVRAADGTPVADALVVVTGNRPWGSTILMMILSEGSAWINSGVTTRTDAKGRYRIVGLKAGAHAIAALAPGFSPVANRNVALPRTDDVPDLALPPAGSLLVRLLDGEGRPESGVSVIVSFDQETGGLDSDTDAKGECRFDSVPPGRRAIQIDTTGTRTITVLVDVTAGQVAKADVRMPPKGVWLEGNVSRGAEPVEGLIVEARFRDPGGREFQLAVLTDSEGRYRLDRLFPGPLLVAVSRRWSGAPLALRAATVGAGENRLDIDLDGRRHTLVVIDAETGRGIPTARIFLSGGFWAGADEEGRISLPGTGTASEDHVVFGHDYGPVVVTLGADSSKDPTRVKLRKSARLTLRLLDTRGRPVPSAEVEIREAGGFDLAPFVRDWQEDLGDAQKGRYVYDLAPGEYAVRITHPQHETFERRVTLAPTGTQAEYVLP